MTTPKGVYLILPTPFTDQGALDIPSLRRLIDFQREARASGVAILGFLGEAHKLAESERQTVVETVIEQAEGQLEVWVGVRALGTMGAVEQAKSAESLGASAVFVAPIGVQNDKALYAHYKAVAESISIPVIIHDFPASFGITLSVDLIAQLGRDGHCPYIKLEEPPVGPKLSQIQELSNDTVGIFGGLGGVYFLEELERGALGIMTGFAFPEVLVRIYELHRDGQREAAAKTFDHYAPLMRYEFQPNIGLAYRKTIYHRRGIFDSTFVRPPGAALDDYTAAELERTIQRTGLRLHKSGVQDVL
ncbi:dihydrodipicolinate synthase family protein [Chloroflexi bacterium TSY]|nr:dihydrodipicolinate synthase family protein [Chloroflexi bacterium TSY]